MVRYADKYDPDLAAAFEKLEAVLPRPLAEHVERTLDVLAQHPRDEAFSEHVHRLTRAWAERRVVTLEYEPAQYGTDSTARQAVVRPYLIEPSLQTHALYLIGWDETRDALRTFKIERIRDVALTPRTFELPEGDGVEATLRRAWDIIADQPPTIGRPALQPDGRDPRRGGDLAREPARPARGRWLVDVARDGRGHHRDPPLDPVLGRRRRGPRATRAARRRDRHDAPSTGSLRGLNRGPVRATDSTAAGSVG